MTYRMNCSTCCPSSMGAYYTYSTHEVFDGFGAASSFDADQVWADAEEGGRVGQYQASLAKLDCASGQFEAECNAVKKMIADANFRGNRAANAIRGGLRALGYSPGNDNSPWGGADKSAWSEFASDNNVPAGPGLVSKAGVYKMGEMLAGGATGKAGMGALGWTLLLLAAAAGTVALVSGRKKKGAKPTGRAQIALRS
jgi:hypothetical protein